MALVQCKECGREISSAAKNCPGCGVKQKSRPGILTYAFIGIIGLAVLLSIVSPKPTPATAPTAVVSPEAQAEKDRESAEWYRRRTSAAATLKTIKANLREPESVQWASVGANKDGTVVCATYRAKNGFGGVAVEKASMANGKISTSQAQWNKNCVGKSMFDTANAARDLD